MREGNEWRREEKRCEADINRDKMTETRLKCKKTFEVTSSSITCSSIRYRFRQEKDVLLLLTESIWIHFTSLLSQVVI